MDKIKEYLKLNDEINTLLEQEKEKEAEKIMYKAKDIYESFNIEELNVLYKNEKNAQQKDVYLKRIKFLQK